MGQFDVEVEAFYRALNLNLETHMNELAALRGGLTSRPNDLPRATRDAFRWVGYESNTLWVFGAVAALRMRDIPPNQIHTSGVSLGEWVSKNHTRHGRAVAKAVPDVFGARLSGMGAVIFDIADQMSDVRKGLDWVVLHQSLTDDQIFRRAQKSWAKDYLQRSRK